MCDLVDILPTFPTRRFVPLLQVLERHHITTTELIARDVNDICRQTKLPFLDLKRLIAAVSYTLHEGIKRTKNPLSSNCQPAPDDPAEPAPTTTNDDNSPAGTGASWQPLISTLDDVLDTALGGGIPVGYVTEITGESSTGKTQLLLTLLLAVQLPPPYGLGRPALYVSTEAALSTRRLQQLLDTHPRLKPPPLTTTAAGEEEEKHQTLSTRGTASLDHVLSTVTPDLESQNHILHFQVPVEVSRRNIGLIVIDSVAANFRAEYDLSRGGPSTATRTAAANMGARAADLVRLGALLRRLATQHNLAVVVANQVADRFTPLNAPPVGIPLRFATPEERRQPGFVVEYDPRKLRRDGPALTPPPFWGPEPHMPPALTLDHQQRWFTGWGDDPDQVYGLKTPSLGLVWAGQIACRIALLRRPAYEFARYQQHTQAAAAAAQGSGGEDGTATRPAQSWRRWLKVVFAPHVGASEYGTDDAVEFEVTPEGVRGVVVEEQARSAVKKQRKF